MRKIITYCFAFLLLATLASSCAGSNHQTSRGGTGCGAYGNP